MSEPQVSVIVPFYKNPAMLRVHIHIWCLQYKPRTLEKMRLILVDDGSPEPAAQAVGAYWHQLIEMGAQLYRIDKDIPWNRGGARNLGAHVATTPWLLHMDIDHVLPMESADKLVEHDINWNPKIWYRFRRFRNGKADDTRMKDKIPRECTFGEIKPHIDSYLVARDLYWKAGGYNEDFSGCLGGGSPFLRELEKVGGTPLVLPMPLHVYTRDTCEDASDNSLSRDRDEYKRRSLALTKAGKIKGHDPLRFPWHRVF